MVRPKYHVKYVHIHIICIHGMCVYNVFIYTHVSDKIRYDQSSI